MTTRSTQPLLQFVLVGGVSVAALVYSNIAYAQAAGSTRDPQSGAQPEASAEGPSELPAMRAEASTDDIVVTGTLIRGIAPAGSNVIGISPNQIDAIGATTTNEILQNLPQNANGFNSLVQPGGGFGGGSSNSVAPIGRPNLRSLPTSSTSSSALTLILIDGHRVVSAGINQVGVDPDVVPPGALERVEAITDGGSAVYGSDAIGGVINFITLRRFDGLKAEGHFGFADNYKTYDANVTAGRDWGSGSLFVSYAYSKHDPIFGRDRDYVRQIDWATGIPTGRQCDLANITTVSGTRTFALPNRVLGTFNSCDVSDNQAFYSSDRQHHVLAGLTQKLNDSITFDLRAFYTNRYDEGNSGPLLATSTVTSANPNYINLPGSDANLAQALSFGFGPALGNSALRNRTWLRTWNITPSVSADLGGGWQVRLLANYGESTTRYANNQAFTANINAAVAAGTLNPYNIAASSPAALASSIGLNQGTAKHQFTEVRGILDGTLFTLPGGDIHVAIGAEYFQTKFAQQITNTANFTLNPRFSYTQSVKSLFGELSLPIFGADNGFAGMRELSLSASGRYDKYNDFGDTFNPKVGITYKPIDWISIFGSWGKSFAAPSPSDQLGVQAAQSLVLTGTPSNFPNGATLNPPLVLGQTTYSFVLLRGAIAGLKPQSSINWSIGTKISPPFIPGLTLSGSYYFIHYANAISSPLQSTDSQVFFRQFPNLVTVDPTPAQLQAFASQVTGGLANLATIPAGGRVVAYYDIRARNLGLYRVSGLDFAANYSVSTGFGSVDASFAGNYQIKLTNRPSPTVVPIDVLASDIPRLRFVATLGSTIGKFRAQATLNHTSGYAVVRSAARLQDRVGAYDVVNLYFRYDVQGSGLGKNLQFTLNVNNVFDKDPPILRDRTGIGFATTTSFTVGRMIQFGVSKKF